MKSNQKGFSGGELMAVLVIFGIIGATGFFVYNVQKKTNVSLNKSANSQSNPKKAEQTLPKYQLPEDWSEMKCNSSDTKAQLASPNADKAKSCDDRVNTVLISDGNGIEECMTSTEVQDAKKMKPVSDYSCEEISINDTSVLKTSADFGGGPTISYRFQGAKPFNITYYSDEDGELNHASVVDKLAKSATF